MAESLLSKGLKAKDAIHIACAAETRCDYFLTTDIGILKKNIEIIRVRNPIDFIREIWRANNMIRNDTLVRTEGMKILLEGLGKVDAERFISLIIKEPFDYTKWQKDLFSDMTVRELSKTAMKAVTE